MLWAHLNSLVNVCRRVCQFVCICLCVCSHCLSFKCLNTLLIMFLCMDRSVFLRMPSTGVFLNVANLWRALAVPRQHCALECEWNDPNLQSSTHYFWVAQRKNPHETLSCLIVLCVDPQRLFLMFIHWKWWRVCTIKAQADNYGHLISPRTFSVNWELQMGKAGKVRRVFCLCRTKREVNFAQSREVHPWLDALFSSAGQALWKGTSTSFIQRLSDIAIILNNDLRSEWRVGWKEIIFPADY